MLRMLYLSGIDPMSAAMNLCLCCELLPSATPAAFPFLSRLFILPVSACPASLPPPPPVAVPHFAAAVTYEHLRRTLFAPKRHFRHTLNRATTTLALETVCTPPSLPTLSLFLL